MAYFQSPTKPEDPNFVFNPHNNGLEDSDRIHNFMNSGYRTRDLLKIKLKSTEPCYMRNLNDPRVLEEINAGEMPSTQRKTFRRTTLSARSNSATMAQRMLENAKIQKRKQDQLKNKKPGRVNKYCLSKIICPFPSSYVNLMDLKMSTKPQKPDQNSPKHKGMTQKRHKTETLVKKLLYLQNQNNIMNAKKTIKLQFREFFIQHIIQKKMSENRIKQLKRLRSQTSFVFEEEKQHD